MLLGRPLPREANLAAKRNAQKTVKVIQTYENYVAVKKRNHPLLPLRNVTTFADFYIAASLRSESSQLNCIFRKAD